MEQAKNNINYNVPPPVYATDILAPPSWNGPQGGLIPWISTNSVNSPSGDYSIFGVDSQVLQVVLKPDESITCDPGTMTYRSDYVQPSTGPGSCDECCKRCIGGGSIFINKYTNSSQGPASVTITPHYPAKIVPIDLSRSGDFYAHPGTWIAYVGQVKLSFHIVRDLAAGCFGGSGFLLHKLTGTGTVFVIGGGTICEKILADREVLLVNTSNVIGFAGSTNYGLGINKDCCVCCFSGEGCFNAKITGPGLAITQSMPVQKLIDAVTPKNAIMFGTAVGIAIKIASKAK